MPNNNIHFLPNYFIPFSFLILDFLLSGVIYAGQINTDIPDTAIFIIRFQFYLVIIYIFIGIQLALEFFNLKFHENEKYNPESHNPVSSHDNVVPLSPGGHIQLPGGLDLFNSVIYSLNDNTYLPG